MTETKTPTYEKQNDDIQWYTITYNVNKPRTSFKIVIDLVAERIRRFNRLYGTLKWYI